jgi:hypothetical protein
MGAGRTKEPTTVVFYVVFRTCLLYFIFFFQNINVDLFHKLEDTTTLPYMTFFLIWHNLSHWLTLGLVLQSFKCVHQFHLFFHGSLQRLSIQINLSNYMRSIKGTRSKFKKMLSLQGSKNKIASHVWRCLSQIEGFLLHGNPKFMVLWSTYIM